MIQKATFALLLFVCSSTIEAKQPDEFGADFRSNYADYGSFKFWVSTIGRGPCEVDSIALDRRLYLLSRDHIEPRLEYWIEGQPAGATIRVRITSSSIDSENCSHIVRTDVHYYAREGANAPNVLVSYLEIGPQLVVAGRNSGGIDSITETIQGQLRFFAKNYRAGGYQRSR